MVYLLWFISYGLIRIHQSPASMAELSWRSSLSRRCEASKMTDGRCESNTASNLSIHCYIVESTRSCQLIVRSWSAPLAQMLRRKVPKSLSRRSTKASLATAPIWVRAPTLNLAKLLCLYPRLPTTINLIGFTRSTIVLMVLEAQCSSDWPHWRGRLEASALRPWPDIQSCSIFVQGVRFSEHVFDWRI